MINLFCSIFTNPYLAFGLLGKLIRVVSISVTKDEVASLLRMFEDHAKHEKIDRGTFRDILYYNFGLTEDILMDRG